MHEVIAALSSADPGQCYEALARRPCLVWQEGMWVAAHPSVVHEVMTHAACRVRPLNEPVPAALAGACAGEVFGRLVRMNDGPHHAVGKAVLLLALAAVPTDVVDATAARIAREVWQEGGAGCSAGMSGETGAVAAIYATSAGAMGALNRWMFEVPVRTVASLLGFGNARLPAVAALVRRFVACLSPLSGAAQIEAAHEACEALLAELGAMLPVASDDAWPHTLRGAPREMPGAAAEVQAGPIMVAVLREAKSAGWQDEHAILANLLGLLSQTYEATAALIGNMLVALQRGAAQCDAAVQNTRRYVAEDAQIGGVDVKKGDVILVVLAAADMPFGHGVHKCPGQQIAQTVAAAAIAAVAQPLAALGPLQWRYRPSVNARIPEFEEMQ